VCRGQQVEARYQTYREILARFYDILGARLAAEAPDLRSALSKVPPAQIPYGYQLLPKLVPDLPKATRGTRIDPSIFSWSRTEQLIDREVNKLLTLEGEFSDVTNMSEPRRRQEYEKMVAQYPKLVAAQRLIANQIDYNRLWQREIALNPNAYDALTVLHDAVLERQRLHDTLPVGDDEMDAALYARGDALSRTIEAGVRKAWSPAFVQIERPSAGILVVRVPLYTDIEDNPFIEAFRMAVESAWRLVVGDDRSSVEIDIRRVTPLSLYPAGDIPARGAHIDLAQHIARFPTDGAVLTTGANTTHVLGRSINLGPHDIAPNVLAHEFGHLLGLWDGYFRGYRNRGPEGYDVLEVVIDPEDIMSAPGIGRVMPQHYQRILDAQRARHAS
jgi:hypothetical protein